MELFRAHNQWATRPADERFTTVAEMLEACKAYADVAAEYKADPQDINVGIGNLDDGSQEPVLIGEGGHAARLSNWAFGQLCQRVTAPADYLRTLPAADAAHLLQWGMDNRQQGSGKSLKLLIQGNNGDSLLRAITGTGYKRFWNWRVCEGLQVLEERGWQVPPARPWPNAPVAFTRIAGPSDVLRGQSWGLSVSEGSLIAPAGLYASDHDMFAFMVNQDRRINVPGNSTGLYRGFFVEHSEVGDSAYNVWLFLYENVCGNHIVWNASQVKHISIAHKGDALERIADNLRVQLREYADSSASDEESKLKLLATTELGVNKLEVVELLFSRRLLTRGMAERAYDTCEQQQTPLDGSNPRTPWGIAQGLTRLSQNAQYADQRNLIDRAAGKVLEVF